jgi:hypothetical protein
MTLIRASCIHHASRPKLIYSIGVLNLVLVVVVW